jgi:uridine kinase
LKDSRLNAASSTKAAVIAITESPGEHLHAKPLVASICGPSGSGKSHLAKAVCALLGRNRCCRVPTDYFLVPNAGSLSDFIVQPLAYDWELLNRRLALPIGLQTSTPDLDFESFQRRQEFGGRAFSIQPITITDAIAPYPGANLVIVLSAPEDVRQVRLAARDIDWGARVQDRWDQLELTWARAQAAIESVDLELDGERSLNANAAKVATLIAATFSMHQAP